MKSFIERLKRWFGKSDTKLVVVNRKDTIDHNPFVQVASYEDKLNGKMKKIMNSVRACRKVSWDLWEMDNKFTSKVSICDFLENVTNWSAANHRVKYCTTKDEFTSEMMGLSLSHEIVEMKVVKSMDGYQGVIMILICTDGDGQTNIDSDVLDALTAHPCVAQGARHCNMAVSLQQPVKPLKAFIYEVFMTGSAPLDLHMHLIEFLTSMHPSDADKVLFHFYDLSPELQTIDEAIVTLFDKCELHCRRIKYLEYSGLEVHCNDGEWRDVVTVYLEGLK